MQRLSSSLIVLLITMALVLTSCQQVGTPPPEGGTDDCRLVFDNTNAQGVGNNAVAPRFVLGRDDPSLLCGLYTYHWNNGAGKPAGTIGLRNITTGQVYGPYPATATPGQGGAPNVNWQVNLSPRIELKPGTYEVTDSDPASWSWNAASVDKGQPPRASGFAKVWMTDAI